MPRFTSFWVVFSLSHLVKYASIGVTREGTPAKQAAHESAHIQVDLCPERLIVWLKHCPFGATVDTFFNIESKSSNRDVLVFAAELVAPIHGVHALVVDTVRQDT